MYLNGLNHKLLNDLNEYKTKKLDQMPLFHNNHFKNVTFKCKSMKVFTKDFANKSIKIIIL